MVVEHTPLKEKKNILTAERKEMVIGYWL